MSNVCPYIIRSFNLFLIIKAQPFLFFKNVVAFPISSPCGGFLTLWGLIPTSYHLYVALLTYTLPNLTWISIKNMFWKNMFVINFQYKGYRHNSIIIYDYTLDTIRYLYCIEKFGSLKQDIYDLQRPVLEKIIDS